MAEDSAQHWADHTKHELPNARHLPKVLEAFKTSTELGVITTVATIALLVLSAALGCFQDKKRQ